MNIRSLSRTILLLVAAVILILPLALQAAKPSGGGGKGGGGGGGKSQDPPNWALVTGSEELMTADGAEMDAIFHVNDNVGLAYPVWLSDGSFIVSGGQIYQDGSWGPVGILLVRPDGSDLHFLMQFERPFHMSAREAVKSAVDGCGANEQIIYFMAGDSSSQPTGWVDIYSVSPFDASTMRLVVRNPELRHRAIAISKDGQLLAVWSEDASAPDVGGALHIHDLCAEGFPVLWTWSGIELGLPDNDTVHEMDWSSTGVLAMGTKNYVTNPYGGADDANIWLVDVYPAGGAGQVSAQRLTGPGGSVLTENISLEPAWSPDGQKLAFVSSGRGKLYGTFVHDFSSASTVKIGKRTPSSLDWRDNWQANP